MEGTQKVDREGWGDTEQYTTWTSPDGNTQRQIDYIMIRDERKNGIRECGVMRGWRGNQTQQRQHAVVGMKICMSWALNYLGGNKQLRVGNGSKIAFDIIALRNGRKEMKEWAEKEGSMTIEKAKENDNEHIWAVTRNAI